MGFLNLFGGDSKSNVKTTNTSSDERVGASDNAVAQRVENATGGTVIIGSDDVARAAIEGANISLATSESFLSAQLNKLFNSLDAQSASIQGNITAAQRLAGETVTATTKTATEAISKSQQTAVDDFMKIIWVVGGVGVAVYALKTGVFK